MFSLKKQILKTYSTPDWGFTELILRAAFVWPDLVSNCLQKLSVDNASGQRVKHMFSNSTQNMR